MGIMACVTWRCSTVARMLSAVKVVFACLPDTLQVTYINGCVKTCRLVAPESRLVEEEEEEEEGEEEGKFN